MGNYSCDLIFLLTFKSQISQQRMQELQPEMTRIQEKYKGKNDERSKMLMAQETQKLYTDNDIHPFGSILVMFIQLPIMMGMFYATMRAATTVYGTFMGMSLARTPLDGFKAMQIAPIAVYVLMILMSLIQLQIPKWLNKYSARKNKQAYKKQEHNDKHHEHDNVHDDWINRNHVLILANGDVFLLVSFIYYSCLHKRLISLLI